MRWALAALLLGCAAHKGADTQPPPLWSTPDGKDKARMEMVQVMLDSHNPTGALSLLATMRQDGVKGPEIDLLHGRALYEAGLFDDATEMLGRIPKRSDAWPEAQAQLGLLAMERKEVDQAISRFEAASDADPKRASYLNNLGFCLMATGRYDDAVDALRRSLALDSTQARTRNNLGFALLAAGREAEAFRVFRAGGSEAEARYNVGVGYELKGDLDAAQNAYREALAADPAYANARQALDRLSPGHSNPDLNSPRLETP